MATTTEAATTTTLSLQTSGSKISLKNILHTFLKKKHIFVLVIF
jgi:hypothetical protein